MQEVSECNSFSYFDVSFLCHITRLSNSLFNKLLLDCVFVVVVIVVVFLRC